MRIPITVCAIGLIFILEFEKLINLEWSNSYLFDIWLIVLAAISDKLNWEEL